MKTTKLNFKKRTLIHVSVMGLLGFLLLHPLSMKIVEFTEPISLHTHEGILKMVFSLDHLPMGICFTTLCIAFGIVHAFYIHKIIEKTETIKKYESILPICANCKAIRDDSGREKGKGEWKSLEEFFHNKLETDFSHGICPECEKKLYLDLEL